MFLLPFKVLSCLIYTSPKFPLHKAVLEIFWNEQEYCYGEWSHELSRRNFGLFGWLVTIHGWLFDLETKIRSAQHHRNWKDSGYHLDIRSRTVVLFWALQSLELNEISTIWKHLVPREVTPYAVLPTPRQ